MTPSVVTTRTKRKGERKKERTKEKRKKESKKERKKGTNRRQTKNKKDSLPVNIYIINLVKHAEEHQRLLSLQSNKGAVLF